MSLASDFSLSLRCVNEADASYLKIWKILIIRISSKSHKSKNNCQESQLGVFSIDK